MARGRAGDGRVPRVNLLEERARALKKEKEKKVQFETVGREKKGERSRVDLLEERARALERAKNAKMQKKSKIKTK